MTLPANYKLSFSIKKIDDISSSKEEDFPTSTKKWKLLITISDDSD